ncbi:hypothetical protein C2857_004052 [Epichloe festucae Fl1]|uniref:Uncharacterized protein n=1 Tax=Epichloe festucae (strain Fl1) TaxID=877507 RepID=A0A7S9PVQ5_EPIFF|nr:hypothetical protein C2857_004052 [Epichloe festucae Fl1]
MHSPSDPADQGRGDSVRPQQDEEGPHKRGDCARVGSPFEDQYDHDSTNVDISGAGTLMTDARLNLLGTTLSNHIHGSSFPFHHQSQFPGSSDEDDEEEMGDMEGGASLDQVLFTTQQPEAYLGSFASGTTTENDYEESDDSCSELSDAINTSAHQQTDGDEPVAFQSPNPYVNFNGPPNFPLQVHTLYGAALMVGAEFPAAAWSEGSWPDAGNAGPQGSDPVAEAHILGLGDAVDLLPPVQLSNPNPTIPGSENLGLVDFLRNWAHHGGYTHATRSRPPHLHQVLKQAGTDITEVNYSDLDGDHCDFQALNWSNMETTRNAARVRRCRTYKNYVNRPGSDVLTPHLQDAGVPSSESFFRFRRMTIRRDVHLAHFQLRSVLACPSRTYAFYPGPMGINRINTVSRKTECVMSMRDYPATGGAILALDAGCGVLVGGTFNGYYYLKPLDCGEKTKFNEGQITSDFSGITNHIKVYQPRRSSGPVAAIASNDCGFRVMDLTTEHFISENMYPFALNCSALSPDHRLRVVVGDHSSVLITNADTGEILQELSGHRDYGFACDWSEDGWTVATGFQDRGVKIWDARKWCNSSGISTPLCTIRSEMASVRGLRFSPLGSGRPVLVAAEETDYVNFIDAQTFSSKQTVDVFGEIGGVSFTNEGQNLNILFCDRHRGGLLQLERCGRRPEPVLDRVWLPNSPRFRSLAHNDDDSFGRKFGRSRRPALLDNDLLPF